MKIGEVSLPLGLMLAPMAGFTDEPMRAMCRRAGAEYSVTEMLSAAALDYGDKKTALLARLSRRDAPCAIQFFGHDPAQMGRAVSLLLGMGGELWEDGVRPAAVDLNMGCPVKKIVCGGDGTLNMRTPALCGRLVEAARAAAEPHGIPITVKIRAGWDENSKNAVEVARTAAHAGAAAVCVHGRTRSQMYGPGMDLSVIAAVRDALPSHIPVIGNGDVCGADSFFRMKRETGCDGVAIGREALGNPWVFEEIAAAVRGENFTPPGEGRRREAALTLAREIMDRQGDGAAARECRGRCAHFLRGMRGAAALRAQIHGADSREELLAILTRPLPGETDENFAG